MAFLAAARFMPSVTKYGSGFLGGALRRGGNPLFRGGGFLGGALRRGRNPLFRGRIPRRIQAGLNLARKFPQEARGMAKQMYPYRPNMRQPNTRQPNMRQPNMRQPNTRQPNTRQPNMRQPNTRQPNMRQPNMRQPNMRQPIKQKRRWNNNLPNNPIYKAYEYMMPTGYGWGL
jgi:hypothetical protein